MEDIAWDGRKAAQNERRHGVSFQEAASVIYDPLAITLFDDASSMSRDVRTITIGESRRGRLLVVVTSQNDGKIRIISARRATRAERRFYEEEI
jgi:uncharacterized DUF497 family protein